MQSSWSNFKNFIEFYTIHGVCNLLDVVCLVVNSVSIICELLLIDICILFNIIAMVKKRFDDEFCEFFV
jgi:hypothetical protein